MGLNTVQKTVVRRRSYAKGEAEMLTELAELEFKTAAKSARKGKLWNMEKWKNSLDFQHASSC